MHYCLPLRVKCFFKTGSGYPQTRGFIHSQLRWGFTGQPCESPSITISFLSLLSHIWHGVCVRCRLIFARRLCKGLLLLVVGLLSLSGHRFGDSKIQVRTCLFSRPDAATARSLLTEAWGLEVPCSLKRYLSMYHSREHSILAVTAVMTKGPGWCNTGFMPKLG